MGARAVVLVPCATSQALRSAPSSSTRSGRGADCSARLAARYTSACQIHDAGPRGSPDPGDLAPRTLGATRAASTPRRRARSRFPPPLQPHRTALWPQGAPRPTSRTLLRSTPSMSTRSGRGAAGRSAQLAARHTSATQARLPQQSDTRRRPSGSPDPGDLTPHTLGSRPPMQERARSHRLNAANNIQCTARCSTRAFGHSAPRLPTRARVRATSRARQGA